METITNDFSLSTIDKKIETLIDYNKKYLIKHGKFLNMFYFFDDTRKLHGVSIDQNKFFKNIEYKTMLKKIIKDIVKSIEYDNKTTVIKALFIYESYYINKNNKDLDLDLSENEDATQSAVVYTEDKFGINIKYYDCISIEDEGKRFTVVSSNPMTDIQYWKLDPDDDVKGILTNLL